MGLGVPLRVTLETGSGVGVIQTGVLGDSGLGFHGGDEEMGEDDREGIKNVGGIGGGGAGGNGPVGVHGVDHLMFVGTVVAPGDRLAEARIASWGVEDVARKFQRYMHDGK